MSDVFEQTPITTQTEQNFPWKLLPGLGCWGPAERPNWLRSEVQCSTSLHKIHTIMSHMRRSYLGYVRCFCAKFHQHVVITWLKSIPTLCMIPCYAQVLLV